MEDHEFLEWLHARLIYPYEENENCHYMRRLRSIAVKVKMYPAQLQGLKDACSELREVAIELRQQLITAGASVK